VGSAPSPSSVAPGRPQSPDLALAAYAITDRQPGVSGADAAYRSPPGPGEGTTRRWTSPSSRPPAAGSGGSAQSYLDWLGPEELQNVTVRELTAELASQGLEVTERYVKQILDQQRPTPQPQRKRGTGARRPRR
jgi:hypothetical protein